MPRGLAFYRNFSSWDVRESIPAQLISARRALHETCNRLVALTAPCPCWSTKRSPKHLATGPVDEPGPIISYWGDHGGHEFT
jgi:hypothetical protein